jgi:hypothetical protein
MHLKAWKNFISFLVQTIFMIFKIQTKGHRNVTSLHKSTFEITKDAEIGPTADCIIGVDMDIILSWQTCKLQKCFEDISV